MWIARWAALLAAVLVALSGAAVASADTTTVGETTLTPNGATLENITSRNVPVFQGDASATTPLVPAVGHGHELELSQRRRRDGNALPAPDPATERRELDRGSDQRLRRRDHGQRH